MSVEELNEKINELNKEIEKLQKENKKFTDLIDGWNRIEKKEIQWQKDGYAGLRIDGFCHGRWYSPVPRYHHATLLDARVRYLMMRYMEDKVYPEFKKTLESKGEKPYNIVSYNVVIDK